MTKIGWRYEILCRKFSMCLDCHFKTCPKIGPLCTVVGQPVGLRERMFQCFIISKILVVKSSFSLLEGGGWDKMS